MTTNAQPDFEANIAANVAHILRKRENLNPHRIAQAMTARGIPIDAKGITRILAGQRRIKFNEAVALTQVLNVKMDEITVPPEVFASKRLTELFRTWEAARGVTMAATERENKAFSAMATYVKSANEQLPDTLEKTLSDLTSANNSVFFGDFVNPGDFYASMRAADKARDFAEAAFVEYMSTQEKQNG
jgi:hypothetical protein